MGGQAGAARHREVPCNATTSQNKLIAAAIFHRLLCKTLQTLSSKEPPHQWLQMNMTRVAGAPAAYADSLTVFPVSGSSSCSSTQLGGRGKL